MKKLRFGTVGFGPRGRSMTRLAAEFDNVEIVAGCDIRTHNWFEKQVWAPAAMADLFPNATFYEDYDEMLEKANEITEKPTLRELDAYLSAGEQMSAALVAMAIQKMGGKAVSLTGYQAGIHTDTNINGKAIIGRVIHLNIQLSHGYGSSTRGNNHGRSHSIGRRGCLLAELGSGGHRAGRSILCRGNVGNEFSRLLRGKVDDREGQGQAECQGESRSGTERGEHAAHLGALVLPLGLFAHLDM